MKADRLVLIAATMMLLATTIPLPGATAHVTVCGRWNVMGAVCILVCEATHPIFPPPPHNCIYKSGRGDTNPCPDQPVHTYGSGGSAGGRSATVTGGDDFGVGVVTVTDTNADDCDGDGYAGDWDGDYDAGVGGGAFGYGPWATDPDCAYGYNLHGPNVVVNDVVFGNNIGFVVGEDDQSGPVKVPVDEDADGVPEGYICETSGSISPGDPATDPTADADDCLSNHYVGSGSTCGSGGGDGLYWVFLDGVFVDENGGVTAGNPPTTGTITAF